MRCLWRKNAYACEIHKKTVAMEFDPIATVFLCKMFFISWGC